MDEVFVNKVQESNIITLDLEEFYPTDETAVFDIKDHLFMGLILKEKDFRETMKNLDLNPYKEKNIALACTADAIIPVWAYMLAASYLQAFAISRWPLGAPERLRRFVHAQYRMTLETMLDEQKVHEMVIVAIERDWTVIEKHIDQMHDLLADIVRDGIEAGEFVQQLVVREVGSHILAGDGGLTNIEILVNEV